MPPQFNRHRLALLAVTLSLGLSACSSGGDDGGSDDPPVNTAPVFTSTGNGSAAENGTAAGYTASASDAESDPLSYSISGGADAAHFTIDAASGVLGFLAAPDFEAPADANGDNIYVMELSASDGALSASRTVTINVTNLNDNPPLFTSPGAASSPEHSAASGYTATATDADGDALSFSLGGGADAAHFAIDALSGALGFVAAPDFENPVDANGDNVYELVLSVGDGQFSSDLPLSISVTDVVENTAPVFTSGTAVSVAENSIITGYTATATDPENDSLSYSIAGGADAARLAVDAISGVLSFLAAPDFELPADADGNNRYEVTLAVSDGEFSATLAVTVDVTDVADNTAPVFTSAALASAPENSTATGYTATATDAQSDPLSFSISGGADAAQFAIDPASGALSFVAAPDFELPADADGNNRYEVTLAVSDGALSTSLAVTIEVTDVADNTAPSFTSATAASAPENTTATGYTASAVDAEGDPVSYSISGGADSALFAIDADSGVLSFVAAPDFETPGDANADNQYQLQLMASDGVLDSRLDLSVSLQNLNDNPPLFTSATAASSPENSTDTGYIATATDADGNALDYSLSGGADAALFAIDADSGALSFLAAPDFELPADANGDNRYELQFSVSDGTFSDTLALALEVTDVPDDGDPLFNRQWHLRNTGQVNGAVAGEDVNLGDVWDRFRGNGVRIAIVDDGLEIAHEDLAGNVVPGGSHDYVSGGSDPTSGYHGTSVAGVAAAVGFNDIGVHGVAPAADLVGFNLLRNQSDANEADAMSRDPLVAVSNNSWGPRDGQGTLDDSSGLWRDGVVEAITNARGGKGTAIFWAGGNGGDGDNSNYDGWANYYGVMAVAALGVDGSQASYSEEGANLLISAPAGEFCDGTATPPTTVTTDRTGALGSNDGGSFIELADANYTQCFNGTSSATPAVAGAAAVLLQARPDLTWRDLRAILARSARQNDPLDADWSSNGAGLSVNHKYGFGALDLAAAVTLAEGWALLPPARAPESRTQNPLLPIPDAPRTGFGDPVSDTISVSGSALSEVDFVDVYFTSAHGNSGDLEIVLTSPAGTESYLHKRHTCTNGPLPRQCGPLFLSGWRFGSVRHLGEAANGDWTLRVRDGNDGNTGFFQSWTLVLRGH